MHSTKTFAFIKQEAYKLTSLKQWTELGGSEIEKVVRVLLEKEDVGVQDFVIRAMPELSAEGGMREVVVEVSELSVENVGDGVYRIKFFLPKGCYATMCVKRMMV